MRRVHAKHLGLTDCAKKKLTEVLQDDHARNGSCFLPHRTLSDKIYKPAVTSRPQKRTKRPRYPDVYSLLSDLKECASVPQV